MPYKYISLLIFTLCFFSSLAGAQKLFVEGEIIYAVRIQNNQPKAVQQLTTGTLTIRLKGNDLVKELNLQPGFNNTIIFNENAKAAYALRNIDKDKYALQLDSEELKVKMQKCMQFTREDQPVDIKAIGGFKTEKTKVRCNNAVPVIVYFTRDWMISNPRIYDDFPSFEYLPLSYEIKNEQGSLFHFELQSIEAKPMDNNLFKVPEGYKVISQEEYRSWSH